MDLEILLKNKHYDKLISSKVNDRGYIIGSLENNIFKTEELFELPESDKLFLVHEIKDVFLKALCENMFYILFISSYECQVPMADALYYAEFISGLDKFFSYCVITEKPDFYKVIKTIIGRVHRIIKFNCMDIN